MVLILISVFVNLIFLATLLALQADLSAFLGVEVTKTTLSILKDILIPISTAFFGAAFGAYIAYRLSVRQSKQLERIKEHSVLLSSFYALNAQINDLLDYKLSIIKPNVNDDIRALTIKWCVDVQCVSERVHDESGYVLAKYSELKVYKQLKRAERTYICAKRLVQRRNDLYDSYRTSLDKEAKLGENIDLHVIVDKFGYNNLCRLYDTTESMISEIDVAIAELKQALDCLPLCMEKHFPNDQFVNLGSYTKPGFENAILVNSSKPIISSLKDLQALMD
ncbi:hypothetical protein [Vibrio cholerae]|uniref:Uncharacterized protein n=2 Tax=Vibrio cholerae TaxID=666 RepID=A0A0K9UFU5_VIBCL|nr:hypothetical protein [Vibrio cholerae]EAZ74514.1 conserved hypothetical protein [Vibrio cholerae NCTC 8457]KFZ32706.1 hypothetical protein KV36_18095 [Vibrio cholerae O1 biovar El Tor]ACP07293.1 hypothetical protein VCM66_A0322 [Vibrio cholerae M66-2]ANR89101.1 hypothetical protein BBB50_15620 [Vibrio cholerae 2740-80]APF50645.1 hypothetical protein ASZ80_03149 [Vibrio cholerae]